MPIAMEARNSLVLFFYKISHSLFDLVRNKGQNKKAHYKFVMGFFVLD